VSGEEDFLVAGQRFFECAHELSRPTMKGFIICGKITKSRTGIIARVSTHFFLR